MTEQQKLYSRVHLWLRNNFGAATKCENKDCISLNPKRFEWALLKGFSYEKKITNFIQLCPSCHRKYDYTEEQRDRMKEISKTYLYWG